MTMSGVATLFWASRWWRQTTTIAVGPAKRGSSNLDRIGSAVRADCEGADHYVVDYIAARRESKRHSGSRERRGQGIAHKGGLGQVSGGQRGLRIGVPIFEIPS